MAKSDKLTGELAPSAGDFGEPDAAIDPAAAIGGPGSGDEFDPAIHVGRDKRNADGSYSRKRGRKSGNGNSGGNRKATKAKATSSLDITATQAVLLSIHAAAASALKTPEFELEGEEAKQLATALAELERQYPAQIDPRVMAWLNFAGVAGMIYGSRFFAWRMRTEAEKEERRNTPSLPNGGNVVFPMDAFTGSQN